VLPDRFTEPFDCYRLAVTFEICIHFKINLKYIKTFKELASFSEKLILYTALLKTNSDFKMISDHILTTIKISNVHALLAF